MSFLIINFLCETIVPQDLKPKKQYFQLAALPQSLPRFYISKSGSWSSGVTITSALSVRAPTFAPQDSSVTSKFKDFRMLHLIQNGSNNKKYVCTLLKRPGYGTVLFQEDIYRSSTACAEEQPLAMLH